MYGDLLFLPFRCPEVEGDNMRNELEIRNVPFQVLIRDSTGKILVHGVVVASQTRFALVPGVRRRIERNVAIRVGNKEGDTIPDLNSLHPSLDIVEEVR